jgi:uncharacterized protein
MQHTWRTARVRANDRQAKVADQRCLPVWMRNCAVLQGTRRRGREERIMQSIAERAWATLFGPSHNDQYAALLKRVSNVALECAEHFRKTKGLDLKGTIDFEHKADRIVDEIHELLDNSFIMRFDIADAMRLADELDDVVDGMRKVALHIDAYHIYLKDMRPEVEQLMTLGGDMLVHLDSLVSMLAEPRLSLARVREVADKIDAMESEADQIVAQHERKLVEEFSAPGVNSLGFIAWQQLFHLLEQMTDDANHCASLILSLARKEA